MDRNKNFSSAPNPVPPKKYFDVDKLSLTQHRYARNFRTPAMRPHLELFQGLNVEPLLQQLAAHPELWDAITVRQAYPGSAHADTQCIFVRGPLGFTPDLYFNDLGSVDFSAQQVLTRAMSLVEFACAQIGASQLGRVLIVNLKPGGHVTPHIDEGKYANHFARFHIVLTTNKHCTNTTGGETKHWRSGSLWWFDHKQMHTADNDGATDRVHLIFDAVSPAFRVGGDSLSS